MGTIDERENLLHLLRFMSRETDEEHPLTRLQIQKRLGNMGHEIGRKQFQTDISVMQKCGVDVVAIERGGGFLYYFGERLFKTEELQLLADSTNASKFLTGKKTLEMIDKLSELTSVYRAENLKKNIFVAGLVKSMDEDIMINVGVVCKGIEKGQKICFLLWDAGRG